MTASDLDAVIARTGHEPLRWLTSDANPDVQSREGYRRIVRDLAAGKPLGDPQPAAAPEPVPTSAWRRAARLGGLRCFYASREPGCGCNGFRCHATGKLINLNDCRECLDQ